MIMRTRMIMAMPVIITRMIIRTSMRAQKASRSSAAPASEKFCFWMHRAGSLAT